MKLISAMLGVFIALAGMLALSSPRPAMGQFPPLDGLPPNVFNISPRTGPTTGGFTITLTGVRFTGATAVSFGTQSVVPTVVNDYVLTVVAPEHTAGVVHLRVTTPAGTSPPDSDDNFTYVDAPALTPTVLSIAPSSGPTTGGTVITIVGRRFTGADYVDFDGTHVIPTDVSDTQLKVTSPPHAAGVVHLRVKTPAGLSAPTSADNFAYLGAPAITSVSPQQGSIGGGTTVTITGTSLASAYQVYFGDSVVAPSSVTATSLVVSSPAHAAGTVNVRVRTNGGLSEVSALAKFTYVDAPPVVTGITPTSGPTTGGTLITISGTGFSGAYAVSFGEDSIAPYTVTDTQLTVISPPHAAGLVHLHVTTPLGTSASTTLDNFTYNPGLPVVQLIVPRSGPVEGGTLVTISGTGFTGTTNVTFDGATVAPSSVTETQITVVSPPHAAGTVHVHVTTSQGTSVETYADRFTYGGGGPQVTSISPTSGPTSGGNLVTITGTGFAGATGVLFGELLVVPLSVTTTQVVALAPPHAPGIVHLRVWTPGGISPEVPADDYCYCGRPVITSIGPAAGSVVGGTVVTINGSGFTGVVSVSFGGIAVAPFSVSENQVKVVSPAVSTSGIVHLRVTTAGGVSSETSADDFTYVALPRVDSVSPRFGTTAGGTIVLITGVGFTGVTAISFDGAGVVPAFVTDTEIHVVSPAHAPGTVHLRIHSIGGISPESASDDFTFVTPGPDLCPEIPLWVNDLAYGSIGGGFYWDPVSGLVWTGQRGWHRFAPVPSRPAPEPLWVNALSYGSPGGGFYWDSVSGLVWTAQRGWHAYNPQGCVPRL
ncbi:MAG: IPT/TIG domain-containing protein [Dehalococcoidia bacterium]